MALTEKDPVFGKISRTPLILKFYNDVAGIVAREFPDCKLGGLIYSHYLFPPAAGLPEIHPNLSFSVASNMLSYGFRFYNPENREMWVSMVYTWSRNSEKEDFDLYYYDLPVSTRSIRNGVLTTPAPEILNFIFHGLKR